jgi:hypothetical protein
MADDTTMFDRIRAALSALDELGTCWGEWADSVRRAAEVRMGVLPDDDAVLNDPAFSLAEAMGHRIEEIHEEVAVLVEQVRKVKAAS